MVLELSDMLPEKRLLWRTSRVSSFDFIYILQVGSYIG